MHKPIQYDGTHEYKTLFLMDIQLFVMNDGKFHIVITIHENSEYEKIG